MPSALWVGGRLVDDLIDAPPGATTMTSASDSPFAHTRARIADVAELPAVTAAATQDLVFISVAAGAASSVASTGHLDIQATLHKAVDAVPVSAHVFLIIPSTLVAPQGTPGEIHPLTIEFHQRNLAAVLVAAETGVSIIDLDRLVAEAGGTSTVLGPAHYTEPLLEVARAEIIRVLHDYRLLTATAVPVPQRARPA